MKIKESNKICIGLVLPYLKSRGTEKQSLRLAKGFIEKGAKVVLFVIQGWGLDKMYQAFSQVGTEVINVGPPLDVGEKKASFSRLESLATLSRKSGCHILISRAGMTNNITGYAAKKNSIPSIIVLSGAVKSNSGINRLKNFLSLNQINRNLGSPTKIVSVSREGAKLFAKNNPLLAKKVTAIPNGIETYINGKNDSDLLLDQSQFNICFSGSIELKRKGLDILIQSLQKLICEQKQKQISLVLIGTGEDEEAIKTLAEQSGIIDHIYFAGEQENPLAVMAQCDTFVLPSRREGLPNALLEAMSIGICSIATDCDTGPREIITHNVDGLLVPVGDAESLANAISIVLKDETRRQQLGERGRKTIQEKFSYEKMVDAYYKLVKKLCKID